MLATGTSRVIGFVSRAIGHLLKAGHRTVWHVSGPSDWFDSQGRIAGWRRALTELLLAQIRRGH